MGSAITVLGPVPGKELGMTLMHEHLVMDFRCRFNGSPASSSIGPDLELHDRWRLVKEPAGFEANLIRDDIATACGEVDAFKRVGGQTIVDVTTEGLGPSPGSLVRIAQATGVNIVASTGVYVHASHSAWVHESTTTELAQRMVDEIHVPDADGVRRGFIGEIGADGPTACEVKTVRAAAIAQRETSAPISIHLLSGALPETRVDALAVVDEFVAAGGDSRRLIACHQDGSGTDMEFQEKLLRQGITLEYDTFGFESTFTYKGRYVQLPTDTQRIKEVASLWDRGWGDQVVLSQDVCYRMMTREWGGWGIAHILESLTARFEAAGVGSEQLETMLIENPRRLLAFA